MNRSLQKVAILAALLRLHAHPTMNRLLKSGYEGFPLECNSCPVWALVHKDLWIREFSTGF